MQGKSADNGQSAQHKPFEPNAGTLVTLVVVAMFNVMGGAAVSPALPAMGAAFPQASETAISLVITLPPLAVAISGLFMGALADRIGKARTLVLSLIVFTICGLSGLFLPTLESLLVGRFIMGIAIAGIAAASAALAAEYYDEEKRAKVYGWQSAASGVSVLVLETGGGFLALLGWRAPFWVYLAGFVGLVLALLFVREPSRSPARQMPASVAGKVARAAGVALAVSLAVAFVSQTISYLVPSKMPYLVTAFGESSAVTGLFLGGFGLANIAGSLASAPLQTRTPRSALTAGCFVALAAGCAFMALAPSMWAVLAGAVLIGIGVGCVTPVLMNWVASTSTPENSGKRMGALATACNLGQFACTLLSGAILALGGGHPTVFAVAGAIALAGALAAVLARRLMDGKSSSSEE